jgi:hypothetical protein
MDLKERKVGPAGFAIDVTSETTANASASQVTDSRDSNIENLELLWQFLLVEHIEATRGSRNVGPLVERLVTTPTFHEPQQRLTRHGLFT